LGPYHSHTVEAALRDAEAAGVDVLVGIYHGDHREFAGREADWPFTMQNYMELVGESMGFMEIDRFKQLKLMQDADAVLAASAEMITAFGLGAEEVRDVVVKDMLEG
jgi:hypothetical protein